LTAVAATCLGIDIDAEAVAMVREQIGYTNVVLADLSESVPPEVQAGKPWDVLVAGEIVEHLDNPVLFLAGLRAKLKGLCSEIIITVPNVFREDNFRRLRSGTECINSDHRYWFTPYTLAKVMTRAGFTPLRFGFVESSVPPRPRSIKNALQQSRRKRYPALRDTLIMVARFD
jgi:2-polyprenyl-3-methyl-5-hydroxy-6-metoxy-1,4-benzoquinol methylase